MTLLLLLPFAQAVDLDARLTTPSGEVKSLTFHDVESSAPPPFMVEMNGAQVRVALGVAPADAAWVVSAELSQLDKKGRAKIFCSPRITVPPNETGMVRQGARIPIPKTKPIEYREEAWQLEVTVRP